MSKNKKNVIMGTPDDDTLNGSEVIDKIKGKDGNDLIFGMGGNDKIKGGKGDDVIDGGDGDDKIKGGKGDDVINAGAGSDKVKAGDGDDTVIYSGLVANLSSIDTADVDKANGGDGFDTLRLDFSQDDIAALGISDVDAFIQSLQDHFSDSLDAGKVDFSLLSDYGFNLEAKNFEAIEINVEQPQFDTSGISVMWQGGGQLFAGTFDASNNFQIETGNSVYAPAQMDDGYIAFVNLGLSQLWLLTSDLGEVVNRLSLPPQNPFNGFSQFAMNGEDLVYTVPVPGAFGFPPQTIIYEYANNATSQIYVNTLQGNVINHLETNDNEIMWVVNYNGYNDDELYHYDRSSGSVSSVWSSTDHTIRDFSLDDASGDRAWATLTSEDGLASLYHYDSASGQTAEILSIWPDAEIFDQFIIRDLSVSDDFVAFMVGNDNLFFSNTNSAPNEWQSGQSSTHPAPQVDNVLSYDMSEDHLLYVQKVSDGAGGLQSDVFVFDLDTESTINLTNSLDVDESLASIDGEIAAWRAIHQDTGDKSLVVHHIPTETVIGEFSGTEIDTMQFNLVVDDFTGL